VVGVEREEQDTELGVGGRYDSSGWRSTDAA
jgi:hypothetical protein